MISLGTVWYRRGGTMPCMGQNSRARENLSEPGISLNYLRKPPGGQITYFPRAFGARAPLRRNIALRRSSRPMREASVLPPPHAKPGVVCCRLLFAPDGA